MVHLFKHRLWLSVSVGACALCGWAVPAWAQQGGEQEQAPDQTTPQSSQASGPGVNEIVVTAQKREQNLIDVPAAVSAFSGGKLNELNISSLPEIATQVPNFRVDYERGRNSIPNFTLRGVRAEGSASRLNESSVAIYSDDVFLGDETGLNALMFDIGRVEVLRGPQGTLFGKNTTGGLVHFISAKPTRELSGYGNIQYGSDNQTVIEGAVSGPLAQGIRARLAARWERDDGHYKNDYLGAGQNGVEKHIGDTDIWGVRGMVDIDLSERTLLRVIGAYAENNSQTSPGRTLGTLKPGTTGAGPYKRAQECNQKDVLDGKCVGLHQIVLGGLPNVGRAPGHGVTNLTPDEYSITGRSRSITANLTHDLDWATLTSITNYSKNRFYQRFDLDAGLTPSIGVGFDLRGGPLNRSHQFSQEVRLNGTSDALEWVMGAYFYKDRKRTDNIFDFTRSFGIAYMNSGEVTTRSYAMFGQVDAHLSDKFTLAIGGRYNAERRHLVEASATNLGNGAVVNYLPGIASPTTNNKDFTGKFSVSYEPDDTNTYYATYSRGIKGAGYSTGFSPFTPFAANIAIAGPVGQEKLDSFELGAKNRLFDRTLSINSALFYYDFDGKQESVFTVTGVSVLHNQNYLNVGKARIYGAETELQYRPDEHWDLSMSGGLISAKITKSSLISDDPFGVRVPLQGRRLTKTPKWNFNSILAYHLPSSLGEFTLQGEVRGQAKEDRSIVNEPLARDESHVWANARLFWKSLSGRYDAQVFVTNLFKERYAARLTDVDESSLGSNNFAEGEGRLWGVKLGARF